MQPQATSINHSFCLPASFLNNQQRWSGRFKPNCGSELIPSEICSYKRLSFCFATIPQFCYPMPTPNPLVTVIIPCYNQAHYLPEALESVSAQTHPHWECIIVNDGSPDNTEEVAKAWMAKDPRFRYIQKVNGGLSSARNAGLDAANGEYIQFLDADDAIHPEKFELQILQLISTPDPALSISSYMATKAHDLTVKHPTRFMNPIFRSANHLKELIIDWELRFSIPVHCFLFKADIFQTPHVRFNESLPNHEDWDCWMNVFRLKPKVTFIHQPLAYYRIRDDAMSYDRTIMKKGFLQAIQMQQANFPHHSPEYRYLRLKSYLVRVKYALIALKAFVYHRLLTV